MKKKIGANKEIIKRSLLAVGIFIAVVAVAYAGKKPYRVTLHEGDISSANIYAPYDFTYKGGIDKERTAFAQKETVGKVRDVYVLDAGIFTSADILLSEISSGGVSGIQISESAVKFTEDEKNRQYIIKVVKNILEHIFKYGVISDLSLKGLKDAGKPGITVISPDGEYDVALDDLVSPEKAKANIADMASKIFDNARKAKEVSIELAHGLLKDNLFFDKYATAKRMESAVKNTPPVYEVISVKKGEIILSKGKRISKNNLAQFEELWKRQAAPSNKLFFVGLALIALIFIVVGVIYLKRYEQDVYAKPGHLLLIAIVLIFVASLAKAITLSPWPSYLIPLAGGTMLMAILLNSRLATVISVLFSVYLGFITGEKLGIVIFFLVGGIVGAYSVRGLRKRSSLLEAGLVIGAANAAVIFATGFMEGLPVNVIFVEALWGLANGGISATLVMVTLPLFEYSFNITTDVSLLELSDLNHPLLKKMIMEAPGTYHHSLIVGNLAENAAEAIGANSLLARVGAYFHDIGKTDKPEYFTENQSGSSVGHDKLTPNMSSLIIINHVKNGIELAKKYKLKKSIMDCISQHHGNNLIYYFYQKALEQADDESQIKEGDYRYPGPRPQTKEAAIVLLADAVEATSRTLSEPTPARIEGLVQKMINNKFIDSQLDECDLTLKDLHNIAESFTKVLTGMFHTRVAYPVKADRGDPKVTNGHNKSNRPSGKA